MNKQLKFTKYNLKKPYIHELLKKTEWDKLTYDLNYSYCFYPNKIKSNVKCKKIYHEDFKHLNKAYLL
jgi:hypothetical protein